MSAGGLFAWALGVMLISVRLAVVFIAAPVFGSVPVPRLLRGIVVLTLAAGLSAGLPVSGWVNTAMGPFELASMVAHELVVGASFAAGLFAGFGAFQFAGRLLDLQIGFGIASLVDLSTRNNAPLLGTALSMLAVLVFFLLEGHHALLRALHLSLQSLPPGSGIGRVDAMALVAQFGGCFAFGLVLVAPVVLTLFLVDLGTAYMSRTMPQMNVFVLSLSLKVVVGLIVLASTIQLSSAVMRRVFETIISGWQGLAG